MKDNRSIKFRIDEKSLFYGCTNDFDKGHTATVSTPLNQSKSEQKWRKDILELIKTKAKIPNEKVPQRLIDLCKKNSKSENIIQDVFIFDNILVDGKKLDIDCQFLMYIKKETAERIRTLDGRMGINTHYGRLKLHYPITYKFCSDGYRIDNEKILKQILIQNKNYAYIVRGFEYNERTNELNIITSLIGPKDALISTIFRVAKGTGKKLRVNTEMLTTDGYEIIQKAVDDDVMDDKYSRRNKTSRYNGKKGEDFIYDKLDQMNTSELYHTSVDYPESPYDIEYIDNEGRKIYAEVKSTQGNKVCFRMSSYEYDFMCKYSEQYVLYMVMDVKSEFPQYKVLYYDDILKLNKKVQTYLFTK